MNKISYLITILLYFSSVVKQLNAQTRVLSLASALEMAEKGNKALQAQILEEIYAAELTKETTGAMLPTISADLAYSRYFDRQTIFLPGSFAGTAKPVQEVAVGGKNAWNGIVALYQPVFSPALSRQRKTAAINQQLEQQKTADLKSRIALQVSTHYLSILMMTEQLGLLEQSLQRNIKALDDARSLFNQGRALKSDTLRSFIEVENIRSSSSYLKNSIKVSLIELKRIIGMDDTETLELSDKLASPMGTIQNEFYSLDEALKIAEQNRKDLLIQHIQIDLEEKRVAVKQAALLPKLAFIGQYQVQAQADDLRIGNYAWPRTSFIGLQLSAPVFNGHRNRSQINQAKIRWRQEQIRLDDFRQEIKMQLASIISKWKEANSQLKIQKTTVHSATLNYQMNEDRFKNGLGSRLELTDAELALTQARINCLRANYNLRILYTEMQHALGLLNLQ